MQNPKRFKQTMRALTLMSTISSYLLGSILVGVFGGRWLDSYFGTNSLFLILGLLLGLGTGSYGVIMVIRHFLKDQV
ncbi:AtpZ/AtpI family protein [Anaerobacillus isosaccharinicus]|uniref:AtpZ/AtpI family protein n=1 Tax=Anaerobacillus isosaccharinicus TaxID=1532552 RepID=A0A7S7LAB1_9BACI|nr:AtpZ/AtpI family protein [Anaerobacillus isosaccharinicus]MBA5584363.1 AtpZ/AtpI family protein [Anaerobacillus isosaccharinicus]QOY37242.1 AtpZ/AtpI family protein [Anaerobacillus isosaccharinicus]